MSGGYFDYMQYRFEDIAESIEDVIKKNNVIDHEGWSWSFSRKTINKFKRAVKIMRQAEVYAQRIDWLLSGDDGEDSFHKRLKDDLEEL